MEKLQLVFVPAPAMGHFISAVEAAKLLVNRHNHLSIAILVMKLSNFDSKVNNYLQSTTAGSASTSPLDRIRFIELPKDEPEIFSFASFIERQKPHVKEAVSKIIQSDQSSSDSPRLAGFVLDWFYTAMIDVANEFGVPSYVFFTSSAAFLGFMNHLQMIYDDKKIHPSELKDSGAELAVPCLVNLFPAKVMPSAVLNERWLYPLLDNFRRFKETKGVIVNTFLELESYAVESFARGEITIPTLYPVGPILNVGSDEINNKQGEIMQWLDDQPAASVVFLCFGSVGSFSVDQVKEIAYALEQSGYRFLWSLRQRPPPPVEKSEFPSDYEDPQEVLPEGFSDRTIGIGKVIGWAPQAAILAHPAVGGFVSHCGWNSILESIWFGVPIATWPMYAEQQFNAFEMVIELGLAVEIKMDYRMDSGIIMSSIEIEKGIRSVMEQDSEVRNKVKKMSEKSIMALMEGGSSYIYLDNLLNDIMKNIM